MQKVYIINFEQSYPFNNVGKSVFENQKTLVKQILTYDNYQQQQCLKARVLIIENMKHPNLINLDHWQQDGNKIQLYFQYIPISFLTVANGFSAEIANNIRYQLLLLTNELFDLNIKFQFCPQNLGVGKNMETKYFINFFQLNQQITQVYSSAVKQSINFVFSQYHEINHEVKEEQLKQYRFSNSTSNSLRSHLDKMPQKNAINADLQKRIQQTKKKTLDLINKLKTKKI